MVVVPLLEVLMETNSAIPKIVFKTVSILKLKGGDRSNQQRIGVAVNSP